MLHFQVSSSVLTWRSFQIPKRAVSSSWGGGGTSTSVKGWKLQASWTLASSELSKPCSTWSLMACLKTWPFWFFRRQDPASIVFPSGYVQATFNTAKDVLSCDWKQWGSLSDSQPQKRAVSSSWGGTCTSVKGWKLQASWTLASSSSELSKPCSTWSLMACLKTWPFWFFRQQDPASIVSPSGLATFNTAKDVLSCDWKQCGSLSDSKHQNTITLEMK